MEKIKKLLQSKNPLIWIDSNEYMRCEKILEKIAKELKKELFIWDVDRKVTFEEEMKSQENPIDFIKDKEDSLLVLLDFHTYLDEVDNWRSLVNTIRYNTDNENSIIIISPIVKIPTEIKPYITLCELPLPDKEEFINVLNEITKEKKIKISKEDAEIIANSGLGLTRYEFSNAIYLSLIEGKIDKNVIYEQKKQLVEKNGNIKIYNSNKGFDTLCGMDNLKDFVKKMVLSGNGRGILIVGVPGGGKTEFAKRLGYETNRITVSIDFGELMGSYVGETEQKTKEVLKIIDTISPCIVFIDEIEKGLSGTTNGDSVSKRQGGQFLKWMQDHTSDAYVVATANDITSLPSEYLRSGRWDAIFFVDMPSNKTKREILNIYKKQYGIENDDIAVENENYTGAEIETLCRLAYNMKISLKEATQYICPIYITMEIEIKKLREWAKNRTVQAEITKEEIKEKEVKKSKDKRVI